MIFIFLGALSSPSSSFHPPPLYLFLPFLPFLPLSLFRSPLYLSSLLSSSSFTLLLPPSLSFSAHPFLLHRPSSALILFFSFFLPSFPPLHHLITHPLLHLLSLLIDDSSSPILVQQVLHSLSHLPSPLTLYLLHLTPQANTTRLSSNLLSVSPMRVGSS